MNRIELIVTDEWKEFAKNQIKDFEKTPQGQWRYADVEAWRGIVCEMLVAKYLEDNYNETKKAKGLDTSGIVDECDIIIDNKKVEIKSATKNYFKFLMPKIHDIYNKPKDIYIASKYNETETPNKVILIGYLLHSDILQYPIEKNKGASYFKIPLSDFKNLK